jgi:hypothetical protein
MSDKCEKTCAKCVKEDMTRKFRRGIQLDDNWHTCSVYSHVLPFTKKELHTVVLRALAPTDVHNEIDQKMYTIKSGEYVSGYIQETYPRCVRLQYHDNGDGASIPNVFTSKRIDATLFDNIEQRARQLQKDVNMDIQWRPVTGIEYQKMVQDSEFQQRWC